MTQFQLKIRSSTRAFYNGDCESLILPTEEGEYGVLANHQSMVVGMQAGEMRYRTDGTWHEVVVGRGFARIADNVVTILADTVERPEEVDVNRAMEAKKRAEEILMLSKNRQEYYRGKFAMARAMARLKVNKRKIK